MNIRMTLTCVVLNETAAPETRVAMVPDVAAKLSKSGWRVVVQAGAGMAAGFPDAAYTAAGATVQSKLNDVQADVLLMLKAPTDGKPLPLGPHGTLITLTKGAAQWPALAKLAPNVLALEKLPRTSRAQACDVLSSQANLAGYAAVLAGVAQFGGVLPPLSTAAGSIKPAKALVLGVGVAGLQAIATLRRLGAVVKAYDVRPEVQEQIISLGAKPLIFAETVTPEGTGGYAAALSAEAQAALAAQLAAEVAASDVVIATAQVPGKPAPLLVSAAAVAAMRPGSVVVDLGTTTNHVQGLSGGNCPLSKADETIQTANGVHIVGLTNHPARVARQASAFWAQNMANLLGLCVKDGALSWHDELITAMHVVQANHVKEG
jgi:H+-translocating NAD(P) transhydrogenase subunit alpha